MQVSVSSCLVYELVKTIKATIINLQARPYLLLQPRNPPPHHPATHLPTYPITTLPIVLHRVSRDKNIGIHFRPVSLPNRVDL